MSGAGSRRKGHQFERDVARAFSDATGLEIKRGFQYRAGTDAPDVEHPDFWIECKRGKQPNIRAALEQARTATDGRAPVAIVKDDRKDAVVVIGLVDFLDLVAERKRYGGMCTHDS